MKLVIKLLFFNIIVFFISMVFFSFSLPIYMKTPITSINYSEIIRDVIVISYGVCVVFTVAFFFLSTSIVDEVIEFIEK